MGEASCSSQAARLGVLHGLGALVLPPMLPPHSGLVPSFPSIPTGSVLLKRMEEGPHKENLIGTRSRNRGNLANKCLCPSALLSFPLYEAKQSIVLTCVLKKQKPSSSPSGDTLLGFMPSQLSFSFKPIYT